MGRSLQVVPPQASCCTPRTRLRAKAVAPYAPFFKALADEVRLEILGLLAAAGEPLCVCDIEDSFELSQPTVSHHLRILREAGLITVEKRGTWSFYSLDHGALEILGEVERTLKRPIESRR